MKKRNKKMWIPNGITLIIIFGALCTGTKKAWDKYQANKKIIITHDNYNTSRKED